MFLSALDIFAMGVRLVYYVRALRRGEDRFGFKAAWNTVILGRDGSQTGVGAEYTNLVADEMEELSDAKDLDLDEVDMEPLHERRNRTMEPIRTVFDADEHDETAEWANDVHRHRRQPSYPQSAASERTLFAPRSPRHSDETLHETSGSIAWISDVKKTSVLKKIGRVAFATSERLLVFAGFMQVLTGIVIYTGGCRQNYINGS